MNTSSRFDVAAFGELLIDLVPVRDAAGQACFAPKPGGAPGNVAVGVARLGGRAAMLTKVGEEAFGKLLVATLAGNGVATEGVVMSRDGNTSLAVVTVDADGDRDFMFYRTGCADTTYAPEEVAADIVRAARVLHIGSLVLAEPVSAAAQRHAVGLAQAAGVVVSADVNLRPSLWRDPDDMRRAALEAAGVANVLKISEEELAFLTGAADIPGGIDRLWHDGMRAMAVTKGPGGAELVTPSHRATVPGFSVKVVDTVGCGDAFMASLLADLTATGFDLSSVATLERLARRACATGALAATAAGGMESLPTQATREAFLAAHAG
jgi:fructokinase